MYTCLYARMPHIHSTHTRTHTRAYTYTHTHTRTRTHTRTYTHAHTQTHRKRPPTPSFLSQLTMVCRRVPTPEHSISRSYGFESRKPRCRSSIREHLDARREPSKNMHLFPKCVSQLLYSSGRLFRRPSGVPFQPTIKRNSWPWLAFL